MLGGGDQHATGRNPSLPQTGDSDTRTHDVRGRLVAFAVLLLSWRNGRICQRDEQMFLSLHMGKQSDCFSLV